MVARTDYSNSAATYYDDKVRVKMSLRPIDNKCYYEYTRYDPKASTNRIKKIDYDNPNRLTPSTVGTCRRCQSSTLAIFE